MARTRNNDAATTEFVGAIAEMKALLARLEAAADDQLGHAPEEINWGHVGTANHYVAQLREISNSVFKEGEHAA